MTTAEEPPYKPLFGYKTVVGVPLCPCRDPGDYLAAQQSEVNPLNIRLQCWCGRTTVGLCDDEADLKDFLTKNGVKIGEAALPTQTGGSEPK